MHNHGQAAYVLLALKPHRDCIFCQGAEATGQACLCQGCHWQAGQPTTQAANPWQHQRQHTRLGQGPVRTQAHSHVRICVLVYVCFGALLSLGRSLAHAFWWGGNPRQISANMLNSQPSAGRHTLRGLSCCSVICMFTPLPMCLLLAWPPCKMRLPFALNASRGRHRIADAPTWTRQQHLQRWGEEALVLAQIPAMPQHGTCTPCHPQSIRPVVLKSLASKVTAAVTVLGHPQTTAHLCPEPDTQLVMHQTQRADG